MHDESPSRSYRSGESRRPRDPCRYPTGEKQLRRWLIDYIAHAFREVQLGDGMTIYTGESHDRYGDVGEDRKSLSAERADWRRVPTSDLLERHCALSFLDAEGLRFYTPAIMTIIIGDADPKGLLTEAFLFHLHDVRASCKVREVLFCVLYNQAQRSAIIRFVKYSVHNTPGGGIDPAMRKTLDKLPRCCSERHDRG
ncbi:DUF6714 family protein [Planctomycetes bacterium TBK1r]|uniref:Uncharacterized protein n=1 Tax=Stieleria magnilauensis TaxID=2527963 RepID=A0ABX5XZB2_9BACT|nr:hypothetical protein TBK1r_63790 [Planctomycetes bacterium TBK1r]